MNSTDNSSYRNIFKATSILGSVQVFNIIIGILKTKTLAVLLGPFGVGTLGLITSTVEVLKAITGMGVKTSAVRDVSNAYGKQDEKRIGIIVSTLNMIVWTTGLFGMVICIIISPWLSLFSFDNYNFTLAFAIVSLSILVDQITCKHTVILQSFRRIKWLAFSSAIGVCFSFIVSVPIYYFYGVEGIAPSLVFTSIICYFSAKYYTHKIRIHNEKLSFTKKMKESSGMLKLGLAMSLTSIFGNIALYLIRNFIGNVGGINDVGLYTAGYSLIITYTGLVFSSMASDYYPRLSAAQSLSDRSVIINQQTEIGLLILTPLLCLCIVFSPLIISILYTSEFSSIHGYIEWGALGTIFKLVSWTISFSIIASGNARLFSIIEFMSNMFMLVLNMLFYKFWGLDGLGGSFMIGYIMYFVLVYLVAHKKYSFKFSCTCISLFKKFLFFLVSTFICNKFLEGFIFYIFISILLVLCVFYSLYILNIKLDIISYFKSKK